MLEYVGWFCAWTYDHEKIYKELKAKPCTLHIEYNHGEYKVWRKSGLCS